MYVRLVGKRCSRSIVSEPMHANDDGNEKVAKRARTTSDDQLHNAVVGSGYPVGYTKGEADLPSSSTTVVRHTPSQSVYHDEGLFVHIASFCDHRTTIRLCTVTKSYCKGRSRLIGKVLYRADTNKTKPKCDPINTSTKKSRLLEHTYAHRKPCTKEPVAPNNDKKNKDVTTNVTSGKMDDACDESPNTSTAGGEFLDGQELIDALMLRVTFDLRWIPTPCPILPWGRKY